ncbi:hypothetical protein VTK56DRAFT_3909 [Thermocarpiscus australiensis]
MDDAARLVSELQAKLAELDSKVAAYQRDMLAEFQRYMDDCLKHYPAQISDEVSRAIAESMSAGRYPALTPTTRNGPGSPTVNHRNAWGGRKSPPPILRHTSGIPKESPRSPHDREKEFHGLFTPTYLPLLDSSDCGHRSPPTSPPPSSGAPSLPLSVENVKKVQDSRRSISPLREGRPDPVRRLTDQSTSSSAGSFASESKVRRSALRRSSSSNKGSPRRVRFEFHGEEVFPSSSSPRASTATLARASGAEPQPKADTSAITTENESSAYVGTSLLDVEGEEDSVPIPRKVSSTQALQALTRSPLEEGTVWTVVNPDPEEPVEMDDERQADGGPGRSPLITSVDSQATIRPLDSAEEPPTTSGLLGSPIEELVKYDDEEADNASEEEFLSMRPKKKTPSPPAQVQVAGQAGSDVSFRQTTTTTSHLNGVKSREDEDDALFDLEEEERKGTQPQNRPSKYLPDPDDEEDEIVAERRLRALAKANEPSPPEDPEQQRAAAPSSVLFGRSIGSYMGRPVTTTPIKDPKLYDEIANMEDVHFFVGSVDGRSGVEPADLGSYRAASLAKNPIGTPRSFTQRLALEEAMERQRAAGKKKVNNDE